MSAGLEVDVKATVGEFDLDVGLSAPPGVVTAVVGPNGSGKSTLARVIAGFTTASGSITLGGRKLLDSADGAVVPAPERNIGVVTQERTLFPHMDAAGNVAFGLEAGGQRKRAARKQALELMEHLGIAELARLRPDSLSGGQAQSVAMARALAPKPDLFLLDEPFSALDPAVRPQMRRRLAQWIADFRTTTLLVTHDPIDALTLAQYIVVLDAGRLVQQGSVGEVTSRPRSPHVAALLGTNLLEGVARGHAVGVRNPAAEPAGSGSVDPLDSVDPVDAVQAGDAVELHIAESVTGPVFVLVPPTAITLSLAEPDTSARNRLRCVVDHLEQVGERVRATVAVAPKAFEENPALTLVAEVTPISVADLLLAEGVEVWVSIKATEVLCYPR